MKINDYYNIQMKFLVHSTNMLGKEQKQHQVVGKFPLPIGLTAYPTPSNLGL